MVTVAVLLILLAVGLTAFAVFRDTRPDAAGSGKAAQPAKDSEPLSARLHRFGEAITRFGDDSSHPRELADRTEFKEAVAVLANPEVTLSAVKDYALGANWGLACVAFAALSLRPDRGEICSEVVGRFNQIAPWPLHFALLYVAGLDNRPALGAPLLSAAEWWAEHPIVPSLWKEHFVRRAELNDRCDFGPLLTLERVMPVETVESLLKKVDHPSATALLSELGRWKELRVNTEFLRSAGRLWSQEDGNPMLIEPAAWKDALTSAECALLQDPPRSVLVTGEARVGKTAFVQILGQRLREAGWTVFEASAADLMADQMYIGQIEGRVRQLVAELAVSKRIVWYVPDLLSLATSGKHRGQSASLLDQVLPMVASRRLLIIAEASPNGATRLMQSRPIVRSVFESVRLVPMDDKGTAALLQQFAGKLRAQFAVDLPEAAQTTAMHLTRQYLGVNELPGAAVDLVKLAANRAIAGGADTVTADVLVATLSQLSGLPAAVLDDKERIDLQSIRSFLSGHVIGQAGAVSVVVDRIAMLKAGLTDPGRPIAVFLFAGPTGTGKTELAKTLAEFLFGSPDRMLRLDMSEFQTPDSTRKILGDAGEAPETDSLIQRVRKQPFAVILLDEFEKAHPGVWDLFLQVFDDGRLSDAQGRVADFRHCMIILTSNLGATSHRGSGLGFAQGNDAFSHHQVLRAVHQAFRPEFINRLDDVIVFKPLTRDLMRNILQKELRRLLERRGLRNREWAVEWEVSAQEFLLDKGFSPEMGARPLKRAIDQYVLAPLAATMVEHRFPAGDQFLFVRSDGQSLQVEFVDPNAESPTPAEVADTPAPSGELAAMILHPAGTNAERLALNGACATLQARLDSESWQQLKAGLEREIGAADFWDRSDRHGTLARFALMDRVKAAAATAESLRERLAKGAGRMGKYSTELVSRLAQQVHAIEQGIQDAVDAAPVEALLTIEPAMDSGTDAVALKAWIGQLTEMYLAWARKRRLKVARFDGLSRPDLLVIGGFGAYRTLAEESGLHVREFDGDDGGRRVVARVRVAPAPLEDNSRAHAFDRLWSRLDSVPPSGAVVRRYRSQPSPLVRDAKKGWRSGKLTAVLQGEFDLLGILER